MVLQAVCSRKTKRFNDSQGLLYQGESEKGITVPSYKKEDKKMAKLGYIGLGNYMRNILNGTQMVHMILH